MIKQISALAILCAAFVTPAWAAQDAFSGSLYSGDDSTPPVKEYFSGNLAAILLPLGSKTEGCWRSTGLERSEFKLTANVMPDGSVTDVVVNPSNDATACVAEATRNFHYPAPPAVVSADGPLPFSFVYYKRK